MISSIVSSSATKAIPASLAPWPKNYKPDPLTQKFTTLGAGGWIKGPLTCLKEAGFHVDAQFASDLSDSTKADLEKRGYIAGGSNSMWLDPSTLPTVQNALGYQKWDWQHFTLSCAADLLEAGFYWARQYVLDTYASYYVKTNVPYLRTGGTSPMWFSDGGRPRICGRIVQADYDLLRTLRIGGAPQIAFDFAIENVRQRVAQILSSWPLTAKPAGDHLRASLDHTLDKDGNFVPTGDPVEHVEVFMLAHLAEACALLYGEISSFHPNGNEQLLKDIAEIIKRVRQLILVAILSPMDVAYDLAVKDGMAFVHDATKAAMSLSTTGKEGDFRKKWIAHGIGGTNAWLYRTLRTMGTPAKPCADALREDAKSVWKALPMLQIQYLGELLTS